VSAAQGNIRKYTKYPSSFMIESGKDSNYMTLSSYKQNAAQATNNGSRSTQASTKKSGGTTISMGMTPEGGSTYSSKNTHILIQDCRNDFKGTERRPDSGIKSESFQPRLISEAYLIQSQHFDSTN